MDIDHTFEILDHDGKPHRYQVQLHPGGDGQRLSIELVRLGLPLLGQLAHLLEGMPEDGEDLGIDFGGAAEQAAKVLATLDDPVGLMQRILRYTWRDEVHLATERGFSDAARGNYAEIYEATARVVAANRFFPVPTTFSAVGMKAKAQG